MRPTVLRDPANRLFLAVSVTALSGLTAKQKPTRVWSSCVVYEGACLLRVP
jgi:hypothetical protein